MKKPVEFKERYIPRDLSWLMFNERVMEESLEKNNPLLERLRFLAIFVNNLDEFQMVRVAGLMRTIDRHINKQDDFGYYAKEVLEQVGLRSRALIKKLYEIYRDLAANEMQAENISVEKASHIRKEQKKLINDYFKTILYPIITPLGVDPGHPFPVLPSKTLAFAVHMSRKGENHLAIVPVPRNVPRLLRLPSKKNEYRFVTMEDIIRGNIREFFKGFKIVSFSLFRVIRDSELDVEEDSTPNLLKAIEGEVKKRNIAKVVYLEVEEGCPLPLLGMLCEGLQFAKEDALQIPDHFDLTLLFELIKHVDDPRLSFGGHVPRKMEFENIFEKVKEGDFIIHVPFDAFDPTVELIQAAARDENVLAIKMTLYRTNKDSAIIKALQEAAVNKKQVTILVEIKARFDEENNIRWARELEMMGCHVIYGIPNLKVHSKMTLIVRKEEGMIKRYVHLSTGNYNENTARVYSDIGYFTCNEDFARDVSDAFNTLTGYSKLTSWARIVTAPDDLRDYLMLLIDREIKFQKKSKNGALTVKLNSLEDPQIIERLYSASQAGVKVRLIVRGICSLVPGVKGLSENIRVISIVGRFLEHTRLFLFNNNGSPRVFLSSADWMRRNFDRRVELLFEITKQEIKDQLASLLDLYWKDDTKSWELTSERTYAKSKAKDKAFNVQEYLIQASGGTLAP